MVTWLRRNADRLTLISGAALVAGGVAAAAMAGETLPGMIPAAEAPPARHASNWLIVDAPQSVNDTSLAVMGPQLGYYYPEIVQRIHLSGAGIEARGETRHQYVHAVDIVPTLYDLLGVEPLLAGERAVMRGDVFFPHEVAEMVCGPLGKPPGIDEYQRGGVTRQAKERIDQALNAIQRSTSRPDSKSSSDGGG